MCGTYPYPSLHENDPGDMPDGGVIDLLQVVGDPVGSRRVEGRLGDVTPVRNYRRLDLLEQPPLDSIDVHHRLRWVWMDPATNLVNELLSRDDRSWYGRCR